MRQGAMVIAGGLEADPDRQAVAGENPDQALEVRLRVRQRHPAPVLLAPHGDQHPVPVLGMTAAFCASSIARTFENGCVGNGR
jgi:hypothetical protein